MLARIHTHTHTLKCHPHSADEWAQGKAEHIEPAERVEQRRPLLCSCCLCQSNCSPESLFTLSNNDKIAVIFKFHVCWRQTPRSTQRMVPLSALAAIPLFPFPGLSSQKCRANCTADMAGVSRRCLVAAQKSECAQVGREKRIYMYIYIAYCPPPCIKMTYSPRFLFSCHPFF